MVMLLFVTCSTCSLTHWVLGGNDKALLGASGCLFALIGIHITSTFSTVFERGTVNLPLPAVVTTVVFIAEEMYLGITTDDKVSRLSHAVGMATGIVMGLTRVKIKTN